MEFFPIETDGIALLSYFEIEISLNRRMACREILRLQKITRKREAVGKFITLIKLDNEFLCLSLLNLANPNACRLSSFLRHFEFRQFFQFCKIPDLDRLHRYTRV